MVDLNHQQQHQLQDQPSSNTQSSSSPQSARWLQSLLSHAGLSTSPHNKNDNSSDSRDSWDAHWLPNYASRWARDRDLSPPVLDPQEEEEDDDEINLEAELDLLQDSDNEFQFEEEEDDERMDSMEEEQEVRGRTREQSVLGLTGQEAEEQQRTQRHPSFISNTSRSVTFSLPTTDQKSNQPQVRRPRSSTTVDSNPLLVGPPSTSYGALRRKPRSSSYLQVHRRSISDGEKETLELIKKHYGRARSNTIEPAQPLYINTFLPIRMVPSSTVSSHQQDKENVNPIKQDLITCSNPPIRPRVLDPVSSPTFSRTSSPSRQNLSLSLKVDDMVVSSTSSGDSQLSMTRSSSLSDGSCHGDAGDLDPEGQMERDLSDIGSSSHSNPSATSSSAPHPLLKKDNSGPTVEGGLKISTFGLPLSTSVDSPSSGPSTPVPRPPKNINPKSSSSANRPSRPHNYRSNSHQKSRSSRLSQIHPQHHSSESLATENQIRAHAGPFISSVVDTIFSGAESRTSKIGGRRRAGTDDLNRSQNETTSRMEDELQARQRAYTATYGSISSPGFQPRSRSRGRTPASTTATSTVSRGPHNLNAFSHRFVARMSSSNHSSRSSSLERRTIKGQRSSSPSPSQDSFSGQSISSMDTIKTTESSGSACPSLSSSMSSSPSSTGDRHSKSSSLSSSTGYMSGFNLSQTLSRAYHSLPIPSLFSHETDSQLAKLERDCPLEDSDGRKSQSQERLEDLSFNESLHLRDQTDGAQSRLSLSDNVSSERRKDLAFSQRGAYPSLHLENSLNSKARRFNSSSVSPLWRETDEDDDDEDEWEETPDDDRHRILQH